ncbi:hypothetical protein NL676_030745 [Syzygium grande]|nr:hypothetical protein NL676_030745 [Syzygium grande]
MSLLGILLRATKQPKSKESRSMSSMSRLSVQTMGAFSLMERPNNRDDGGNGVASIMEYQGELRVASMVE